MGLCQSTETSEYANKALSHSQLIDKELAERSLKLTRKLLLLGPSESGKSTCVKQMQILHGNGFTDEEVEERRCIVFSNTVRSMLELALAVEQKDIEIPEAFAKESQHFTEMSRVLKEHINDGLEYSTITVNVKDAIKWLWKSGAIRKAYEKRSEFHVSDSAEYFFSNIERIAEEDYKPTEQDILLTRTATTGIVKFTFELKGIEFHVYDVGGQRSERRKWIHFFDDVNAVIFVAAISEYDQKLREDNKTNRVVEALDLFDNIANSKYFANSSIILFLNKKDLFAEKIEQVPLTSLFPNYRGGMNYEEGIEYIRSKFLKVYKNKQKLYIHDTCATDTDQINRVFNSVLDSVIRKNMTESAIV